MSFNLRSKIIRLAHQNPELRTHLLPLLKESGCEKLPEGGMRENCEKKVEEGKADKKEAAKAPAKLKGKKLDDAISKAYYRHGNRVEVNMMDIPKIYREAEKAYLEAASIEEADKALDEAMKASIAKYRLN